MPESTPSYARKFLSNLAGVGEVGLMMGTGAVTEVAGGLAGLASLPFGGAQGAGNVIDRIQNYTYQPRGSAAQRWLQSAAPHIKNVADYWSDQALQFEENTGFPREATMALPIVSAEIATGGLALKGAKSFARASKYKPYKETKEYTQREKGGPKEYVSEVEQRLGKQYDHHDYHQLTLLHAMKTSGNTGNKSWYTKWDSKRYEELKAKYGVDNIPKVREIFETDEWPLFLLDDGKVTNNLIRNPNYGKKDGDWGSKDREYEGESEFDSFEQMKDWYEAPLGVTPERPMGGAGFEQAWNTTVRNIRYGDVKQDIKSQSQRNLEDFLKDDEVPSADIPMFTDVDTGKRISLREMQEMNKRGEIKKGPWEDSLGLKDKQRLGKGAHTDELWNKKYNAAKADINAWISQFVGDVGSTIKNKVGSVIREKVNLDNHPDIRDSYIKNNSKLTALEQHINTAKNKGANTKLLENNRDKLLGDIWKQEVDIISSEKASGRIELTDVFRIP